ncbi:hypothetical protein BK011_00290 [Tenericutes bacterium MZ-XQ]|jgi:uncharacterized membrane protein YvlD (DUF360 family)|nr:hypothetical protein BK011_00290 [Tenericutes bacterium MZ-XQ]
MNDKDPKKPSEEDIKKLIEQLNKKKSSKNTAVSFGFLLHKNYVVHMVLSLLINFLISAVVIGLASGINQPLVELEILGYILAIILLTLIENFVKILMFKFFMRAMILSMGLLSILVQIVILAFIDMILIRGFRFIGVEHLIIFSFIFTILRFVLSTYIRRWLFMKKIRFLEGK